MKSKLLSLLSSLSLSLALVNLFIVFPPRSLSLPFYPDDKHLELEKDFLFFVFLKRKTLAHFFMRRACTCVAVIDGVLFFFSLSPSPLISFVLKQWHALSREEQAKYYELARKERQLHMQLYPGWSARDNYVSINRTDWQRCVRASPRWCVCLCLCVACFILEMAHNNDTLIHTSLLHANGVRL